MSLHHLAHMCLATCYLMANMIPLGLMINFLHDISDILTQVTKLLHLTGNLVPFGYIAFVLVQVGWLYFRILCLPMILFTEISKLEYDVTDGRGHLQPYITMSKVFLGTLFFLHCYWMWLFLKMDYNQICKGDSRDI